MIAVALELWKLQKRQGKLKSIRIEIDGENSYLQFRGTLGTRMHFYELAKPVEPPAPPVEPPAPPVESAIAESAAEKMAPPKNTEFGKKRGK